MLPPPDAYTRVTNPERFGPLHALALDLLKELHVEYDATSSSVFNLLPGMVPFEHARPPLALTPADPKAAPIAVAFTDFPSLILRLGRWMAEPFPSCACDACAETAESEGERLERIVRDVVAGHFWEELSVPRFGQARLSWQLGSSGAGADSSGGRKVLSRARARVLRRSGSGIVHWLPGRSALAVVPPNQSLQAIQGLPPSQCREGGRIQCAGRVS